MEGKYNPKEFEENLYKKWQEKGYFKPNNDSTKENYCIMMPPPNVTGKLHMGHALDDTIQDILIRFKRMKGYNTLWLPGSDHASISTEMKVVQKLKTEGKTKYDIGREAFLKETWDWTHLYGGTIQNQQKMLGCSCDWDRRRFTLDNGLSDAVLEEFINLYKDGYIYKGKRMINWCPNCHTAISDAEVEYKEEQSHLWRLRYKIKDEDKYVEVATTRPETMLGDTAVAVNPEDDRYKEIVGKVCILPIVNREIPIIADEFVDKEFGTGCVKITPAHDPNDYQAGLAHNLEIIEVFDEYSIMGDLMPEVKGMSTIEARQVVIERLKEIGALVSIEDYTHNVGKCERCKTTVEPRISEQWFVKMKDLANPAIKAVKDGDIKFVPEKYTKTYFNWLENIQDWCISRQLWWGHRIPAYYCEECGHISVSKIAPEKCEKCGCEHLKQDEDTLDTWFSSALWPFSTLGWPDKSSEDLKTFFPTDCLVTGYDIIFFWVVRMVFSSYYALGEKPFSDVVIHGMVRDSQGRKMSKTLGNGIDPIEIIEEYGADSMRFSVISGTTMGNDIKYIPEKLEQASNFANKIWNAAKFILMNISNEGENASYVFNINKLNLSDRWIVSKLNTLIKEVTDNIEKYDLGVALDKLYNFIWNDFCNWYIEIAKIRLNYENREDKATVIYILKYVFENSLKLLHPFMPFVTSKIYEELTKNELMISQWPKYQEKINFKQQEEIMENIQQIIVDIRNIRNEKHIHPTKKANMILVTKKYKEEIKQVENVLLKLGFANFIEIKNDKEDIPDDALSIIVEGIEVYLPVQGLIDLDEEKKRLEEEKIRFEAEVERCKKMLSNPGFVNKAPESKINEEKSKLKKYTEMLNNVIERLK